VAGSSWIRVDCGYFRNPKIVRAGPDAALLHLAAVCYLGEHNIGDGLLPGEMIDRLGADVGIRRSREVELVVERLVKCSLWHPGDAGGFIVHDYDTTNGDKSEAAAARRRQAAHRNANRDPETGQYR
jgi:hypothetical protein